MSYKQNKVIVYGLGASGKSASIATLFKLKDRPLQRVIYLCTERNAIPGLEWGLKYYNIELKEGQLYTCVIRNKKKKAFSNEVRALGLFSKQSNADSKTSGSGNNNKDKYGDYINIINGFTDFKGTDYVTKEEVSLGNVGGLEEEDILIIDGLTPIMMSIWEAIKGDRINVNQGDYLTAQHLLRQFTKGIIDLDCSTILMAHADRIFDDISKEERIRVALDAGSALAGKYCGSWANVVYQYQDATGKRYWTGKKQGVEVAVRDFPEKDKLLPDFSLYDFF